ncbi:MAG: magnesium/cobalt transporter CorA [Candidatus Marinimicrobia bacterium]|nr:magnesium/cobalt transporter CorA [Candidatus Neomarinimicrobiota bacterium]
MPRFIKKLSKKKGLPPGTLIHVGEEKEQKVISSVIHYNAQKFSQKIIKNLDEYVLSDGKDEITWINIDGVHQTEIIEQIGNNFNIHPLVLEDILNTDHRPKIEDFGEYIFIVLKMMYFKGKKNYIQAEQVSLIVSENNVISFQEQDGDVFGPIRDRLENNLGKIRKMKADYLAYALIDSIVDNYFAILEEVSEKIESLEVHLVTNPTPNTLQQIHNMKSDLIFLRKSVWPLREVISSLERRDSKIIAESTQIYFRDIYDHTIQVMDAVESAREMLASMMDIYLSSISNRMNEIMKVLTMFSTIFIPLTFIAGIYGMNFQFMPELRWKWGYFGALGIMAVTAIMMALFFRRKKWL